jgi:hypothetical protein
VKAALADASLDTPHVEIEGEPLLTGSTAELQQLLLEHGDDEGVFAEEALVLHRVPESSLAGL